MDLAGVSAAVPTPFHDDGTLDRTGLAALVEAYGEAGAERMAVLGSSGEGALLDERERNTVISTARAAASGLPLLVGVAAGEPRLEAAQREVSGADVLLVELTGSQSEQHPIELETLAGLGPPLVLDHHAGAPGPRLKGDEVLRLAREGPVDGVVVQSPPTPDLVADLANASVPVVGGLGAVYLLEELESGALGTLAGLAAPERLVEVVRRWGDGDPSGAREAYLELATWLRLEIWAGGVGLVVRKEAWRQRGIIASSRVRRGVPLGMATKTAVTRRLQELGLSTPAGIVVA